MANEDRAKAPPTRMTIRHIVQVMDYRADPRGRMSLGVFTGIESCPCDPGAATR